MLLAEHILNMTSPEELFPAGEQECKRIFHELAMVWHPDRCPGDAGRKVFSHISVLYTKAQKDNQNGVWDYRVDRKVTVTHQDNSISHLSYFTRQPFELGVGYVGPANIFYVLDEQYAPFAEKAVQETANFKFATDRMRQEHSRYLPKNSRQQLKNGKILVTTFRNPDLISLRSVLKAHKGSLVSADVMWIMSCFYNISCYLSWAGQVHGDISLDSCFIDPQTHMGALLGSWFYSQKQGTTIKQVTRNAASVLPWVIKRDKIAKPVLDLELIKKLGRDLLGPSPDNLLAHQELLDWLNTPAEEDAFVTYKAWITLIKTKFGRKFHRMDLAANEVYI